MAAASGESGDVSKKSAGGKALSQEQIVAGFQELRNQQRAIISKMSEIDLERKEHELVVEALKEVDGTRRCYRMVGGVLVERTVADVLPALNTNHDQLVKLTETLSGQLEAKGKDLQDYREKYNIRVRGEDSKSTNTNDTSAKAGVLVGRS